RPREAAKARNRPDLKTLTAPLDRPPASAPDAFGRVSITRRGGKDMQQTASARAPAHLWIVGILTLLWNGFGCFDYFMTKTNNQGYLSQMPADAVAYANSLPGFATFFWAIGVWGGLAGAILLLMRSRHAVLAFAVSLVGAVVGLGY